MVEVRAELKPANRKKFPYIMLIAKELQKFSPLNALMWTVLTAFKSFIAGVFKYKVDLNIKF